MSKLITYPTAKLAKEKGYKLDLYYCDSKIFNQASAPSQESIQDWLIEKHGVAVLVDLDCTLSWMWKIIPLHPEASIQEQFASSGVHSAKQLALEKGLVEALTKLK